MRFAAVLAIVLVLPFNRAIAWWDEGHMQIAYVAYQNLTVPVRAKVDILLKLNDDYQNWTCDAPDQAAAKLYAFVRAATWVDDIKLKPGYINDKVTDANAAQNVGYSDKNRHPYWHYKRYSLFSETLHCHRPIRWMLLGSLRQ